MKTIYKYYIHEGENFIESYRGASMLSAGIDCNGAPCVWMEVDTSAPAATFKVYCVGTGWPLDEILNNERNYFINTINDGEYIWHVFIYVTE